MKIVFGRQISSFSIGFIIIIAVLIFWVHQYNQEKEPIKVGLSITLTGRPSTFGVHVRNGITLAQNQLNQAGGIGGRPIELIIKDDKGKPEQALRVDQELLDAGVAAIIGHSLSTPTVASVPLMNNNRRLLISPTASTADLSGSDDFFIRITTPVDIKAPSLATLALDKLELQTIAVVYDLSNPNYTVSLFRYFKQEFEELGGQPPIATPFNSKDNFSAPKIVQKIISADPEGVFIISNAIHAAMITQHLRSAGSKVKIIVSQWGFPDPAFIKNGGNAVEGAVSLAEFNAESNSKSFIKLKAEYEHHFGSPIGSASQRGYEVAQILFSALSETEDPAKLKAAIIRRKVFESVDGNPIIIDDFGDVARTLYILEIKNRKIRTTGRIEPRALKN